MRLTIQEQPCSLYLKFTGSCEKVYSNLGFHSICVLLEFMGYSKLRVYGILLRYQNLEIFNRRKLDQFLLCFDEAETLVFVILLNHLRST